MANEIPEKKPLFRPPPPLHLTLGAGAISGLWAYIDPVAAKSMLSQAMQTQVGQMTAAFTIAAWLHRGWVKKDIAQVREDIALHLGRISDAMNNLAKSLGERLDKVETNVEQLSGRVEKIEYPNRGVQ